MGSSEWGWRCGSGEPEAVLLGRPLGRQIDIPNEPMRGQLGRLTSRRDRLDNLRREKGERQQAADVAIADPFDARQLGHGPDPAGDQSIKAAVGPLYLF